MEEEKEEKVDLLFCLDATGSMRSFIEGVKNHIRDTVAMIVARYRHTTINLGFVAYRDYSDEGKPHPRIQIFPFNQNLGAFQQFVGDLEATGGGDYPEDVLGGLWESANMGWSAPTRVLFHIFDAPPHGRDVYHSCPGDLYPAGHPNDRPLANIFREFQTKNVDYYMMVQGLYSLEQMVTEFKSKAASIGYEKIEQVPTIKKVEEIMKCVGRSVLSSMGLRVMPRPQREHSVSRPMVRASSFKVYCGIDFGTHGSAFATCTASDPVPRAGTNWGGAGVGVKTLTNVLLGKKKKIVDGPCGFGDAAQDFYLDLDPEDHSRYYLFQRFKMELYKSTVDSDERKEEAELMDKIQAANGRKVRAETVLVEALKFIIDRAMEKIHVDYDRPGHPPIQKTDVQWILTVPAIWSQKSRRTMEKVGYRAGIPRGVHDQLIVALEPECACVAAQDEMRLSVGDCYMMIDGGGGTVDIACHEMITNTEVKEIHPPSGGPWGATYIDDAFWQTYLPHLFGEEVVARAVAADSSIKQEVMHNFSLSKNQALPGEETRKVRINPLMAALKAHYGSIDAITAHLDEVQFPPASGMNCGARLKRNGQLIIERRIWDYFFDSVISRLIDHVRGLLARRDLGERIQTLCIVGGFADSPILKDRLQNAFGETRRIVVPTNPRLSVVTGAAKYGLAPTTIAERCAPKTLGIAVRDLWKEEDGEDEKKFVEGEGYVVEGRFYPFVRRGQAIPRDERARIVHYFEPLNLIRRQFVVKIYQSEDPDPQLVPDEPCGVIGPITFPDDFEVNLDGIRVEFDFSETLVQVRIFFGETEYRPEEPVTIEFFEDS